MAKKKSKKAQAPKQPVEASPPPSPKAVPEEPVPAVPTSLPLSPETAPTDSIPDDSAPSLDSPAEANETNNAPTDASTAEIASEEAPPESAPVPEGTENPSESKEEGNLAEDPDLDVSAWTTDDPASEAQPAEEQQAPESESTPEVAKESSPEVAAEQTSDKTVGESAPPEDDDWGSFTPSKKKKKGKKAKKETAVELTKVEQPEVPIEVEAAVEVDPPVDAALPVEPTDPPVEADPVVEPSQPPVVEADTPVTAPEPPTVDAVESEINETAEPQAIEASQTKKKGKKGKKVKLEESPTIIQAPEVPDPEALEQPPAVPEAEPTIVDIPPEAAVEVPEPPADEAVETNQEDILQAQADPPISETISAEQPAASENTKEPEPEPEPVEETPLPEPSKAEEVVPEPPKAEESLPEPPKVEEAAVDEWAPPVKSTKKKGKKGKKSKEPSVTVTPTEEPAPPTPEPVELTKPDELGTVTVTEDPVSQPEAEETRVIESAKEPEPEPVPQATVSEPQPEAESEPLRAPSPPPAPEAPSIPTKTPSPPTSKSSPVASPAELKGSSRSQARAPSPLAISARNPPMPSAALSPPVSVKASSPPRPKPASPAPAQVRSRSPPLSEPAPASPRSVATERPSAPTAPLKSEATNQVIEEDRPPAPTPPVTRARPRRAPIYDDDDEDDSALIQPRLRGDTLSRDSSRGSYPPAHSRPLFASRVPQPEHYSEPSPQPAPPQYHHPRHHYPPAAPPYYHPSSHAPSHAPTHSMSQASGYRDYPPYGPPSHGSSPHAYQESWSHVPPNYGYNGHSPPQRHDPMRPRDYPNGYPAIENGSAIDDGPTDAFSRIAHAIHDLPSLLANYKETQSQLAVREDLFRRATSEHQDKLRAKDDEIETMRDRITSMERKHSTEANRLRLEVGNMEEQVRDLRERLVESEKFKIEAAELREALDATTKSWEAKYKDLEEVHATLEKTSSEEIAKTRIEFEEWKTTTTTRNDAEKIALAVQFDKKIKEAEVAAENERQKTSAAHIQEKDDLRSEHQRQQREREESFDRLRSELEQKLAASQLDCEQALKRERETMEVWAKERGTLVQAHREDVESLRKSWEDQRSLLEGQHKKIKEESDKAWIELHTEANRKAEENKAVADQLSKEKEELLKQYNDLKLQHEKEKEIIKSVATNMESEKSRLEKLMESYGDIAEIKSKGDTYYLVSFTQLQKQILDLAATHFVHLPVIPPPEELQQIPSHLPSFLADTSSSRQLRAAYVAHTVSKLVTYRVFGPFLFSLGRRYDKADSLFLSMSNHIRDKSTRKEAIWRQQTLLAAFTSSGAKQRINTAAGTVVEEIVNAIKHFADPKEEEAIKIAVKRIVKLAAETWRFARLEREMISATMPALYDEDHDFAGPKFWPSHRPEGSPIASLVGTEKPSDEQPKMLLRLFPVIYREPKHENFRDETEKEQPDEGCIYHHGLALYDDAEPVLQRKDELQAAGLPTTNAASPTAADFPLPLLPAPRTSLPPTPVMDKASVRSKSPPPSRPLSTKDPIPTRPASPASIKSGKTSVRSKTPPPVPPKRTSIRSRSSLSVRTDRISVRSSSPPPPPPSRAPPPPPTNPSELSNPPDAAPSEQAEAPYTRPPPGPIDFDTPRDALPLPAPTESVLGAPPASMAVLAAEYDEKDKAAPPLPEPTEVGESGPSQPEPAAPNEELPPLAPTESAIIPLFDPSASNLPTSHSRAPTPAERPVSPLFAAIDEIDALSSHRSLSRRTSSSRRSARSKRSDDDLQRATTAPTTVDPSLKKTRSKSRPKNEEEERERPDSARRASGYALSTRSSKEADTASLRTESTERPSTGRSSRYLCESRSAAIKGLYPNSPLAGSQGGQSPQLSRTNSLRSQKRRSSEVERRNSEVDPAGTWDTTVTGGDGGGEEKE